ncbi:MAG: hypothetical protein U5K43_09625 [Halofilum sp. (in: g-proteobacteria)]|nr:hypothetical protein [Halofilum sp. (in: g-proteobacteria)]
MAERAAAPGAEHQPPVALVAGEREQAAHAAAHRRAGLAQHGRLVLFSALRLTAGALTIDTRYGSASRWPSSSRKTGTPGAWIMWSV